VAGLRADGDEAGRRQRFPESLLRATHRPCPADGLHFQHYVTLPQFLRDGDSGALGRLVDAHGTTA
jgi:hypothetical protein